MDNHVLVLQPRVMEGGELKSRPIGVAVDGRVAIGFLHALQLEGMSESQLMVSAGLAVVLSDHNIPLGSLLEQAAALEEGVYAFHQDGKQVDVTREVPVVERAMAQMLRRLSRTSAAWAWFLYVLEVHNRHVKEEPEVLAARIRELAEQDHLVDMMRGGGTDIPQ